MSLIWRLFVPNAVVLTIATIVLWIEPANGRIPLLASGLGALLAINLVLMRRAVRPLATLTAVMRRVDPLEPGRRIESRQPVTEVAVLADAFNEMLDRLEHERRDSAKRALAAQQEERRRISRELHDEIGQGLTALALRLDRVIEASEERAAPDARAARATAAHLLEEVRGLAHTLRPDLLDDVGLGAALADLCERARAKPGLKVECRVDRRLDGVSDGAGLVIYRVAQEALTNVMRHAEASRVEVELIKADDGGARLVVRDDGRGMNGDGAGSGIRFMRERAVLVGGRLALHERPGGGTEVELTVPAEEMSA